MAAGMILGSDVASWEKGRVKLLPRRNGGWVRLTRVGSITKLTMLGERGMLESEMMPGEGEASETVSSVS